MPDDLTASYAYGGQHRRTQKAVEGDPDVTYHCYWDESWRLLEVRKDGDENAHVYKQFIWGIQYIDAPMIDAWRGDRTVRNRPLVEDGRMLQPRTLALTILLSCLIIASCLVMGVAHFCFREHTAPDDPEPYDELGNHPLCRAVGDDPDSCPGPADILGSPDLSFTMGEGDGLYGYDVIKIRATGEATYTFAENVRSRPPDGKWISERSWRRATFRLQTDLLKRLRELLVEVDFSHLKRAYHADVVDGVQWFVKLEAGRKRKSVYCNNYFPAQMRKLSAFIHDEVLGANEQALREARRIELEREDWEKPGF